MGAATKSSAAVRRQTGLPTSQVCDMMRTYALALEMTIETYFDRLPSDRRNEIGRLAKAMWREIVAVQHEARAVEKMLNDPAFTAFKVALIEQRKRTRGPRKATADVKGPANA